MASSAARWDHDGDVWADQQLFMTGRASAREFEASQLDALGLPKSRPKITTRSSSTSTTPSLARSSRAQTPAPHSPLPVPSLSASASSAASTPSPRTIGSGFKRAPGSSRAADEEDPRWCEPLHTPEVDAVEVFVVSAAETEAYAQQGAQSTRKGRSRSGLRSQKSLLDIRGALRDGSGRKADDERDNQGGLGSLITRLKSRSSNNLRGIAARQPGEKALKTSASTHFRREERGGPSSSAPPVPALPDARSRLSLPRRDTEPHKASVAAHQPLRGPASAPPVPTATVRARAGSLLFQLPDDPFASFQTRKSAELDQYLAGTLPEEAVTPARPALRSAKTAPSRPTTVHREAEKDTTVKEAQATELVKSAIAAPADSTHKDKDKPKGGFLGTLRRPASFKNLFHAAHGHSNKAVHDLPSASKVELPHSESDQFVFDISAPPVPSLPSLPSIPSVFGRPSLTVDTAVGGSSAGASPSRQGGTPSTAGLAVSGSFYDLYAELGIDPPEAEPTSAYTPAYPSGLADWVAEKNRTEKQSEATTLTASPSSKTLAVDVTPKKAQRKGRPPAIAIPPSRTLSAPPPRLEFPLSALQSNTSLPPIPLASPLTHILPWSDEVFAQTELERKQSPGGAMMSGSLHNDYQALSPLSGISAQMSRQHSDRGLTAGPTRTVSSGYGGEGQTAGGSATTQAKDAASTALATSGSFRLQQGTGRNRERSSSSRSPSSSRDRRFRTSSPAALSDSLSEDSSSDSDSNPGLESEERLATSPSSDDVPLAQRIPGALQVQKSMQKQRREERRARQARRQREKEAVSTRVDGRDNPRWVGEGGVPARALSSLLERIIVKRAQQDTAASGAIGLGLAINTEEGALARRASGRSYEGAIVRQRSATLTNGLPQSAAGAPSRHVSTRRAARTADATREPTPVMPNAAQFGRQAAGSSTLRSATSQSSLAQQSDREWFARAPTQHQARSRDASLGSPNLAAGPVVAPLNIKPRLPGAGSPLVQPPPSSPLVDEGHTRSRNASGDNITVAPTVTKTTEQRVLIGSAQGPAETVHLHAHTTCNEVIQSLKARGALRGEPAPGIDWVMFEIFGELGLERPIRDFEYLLHVTRGWNSDVRANAFLVKQSPNVRLTAPALMPRVAPMFGAYVQWESKKGKWSKRWLETRNGHFFLSKSDKLKDETFLCSASAFDVYTFYAAYKSPKPFTFALKSNDNPTLFENPDDYLHIFSCESAAGPKMLEALYSTTSFCNLQDRPDVSHSAGSTSIRYLQDDSQPVRHDSRRRPVISSPLVDVKPNSIFAGGSLLSRLGGK